MPGYWIIQDLLATALAAIVTVSLAHHLVQSALLNDSV
jgi:hypothetical protein